ncbi:hypothetical protein ACRYHF_11635 [Stutzerimonas balearica]|uniref:hypothetical protein n=1 Tax=Stutzerimonas balearica TaxID=74829 RepID=UPI003F5BE70F
MASPSQPKSLIFDLAVAPGKANQPGRIFMVGAVRPNTGEELECNGRKAHAQAFRFLAQFKSTSLPLVRTLFKEGLVAIQVLALRQVLARMLCDIGTDLLRCLLRLMPASWIRWLVVCWFCVQKTLSIGGCDLGRDLEQELSPLTAFRHSSICSKTLPVHVDTMDM